MYTIFVLYKFGLFLEITYYCYSFLLFKKEEANLIFLPLFLLSTRACEVKLNTPYTAHYHLSSSHFLFLLCLLLFLTPLALSSSRSPLARAAVRQQFTVP